MASQQGIDRTLNFAEANIQDGDTIRLFRDYAERRFLVGYCKADKRKWIKEHNLYPIRPDSTKRRGGLNEKSPLTYAVDYLILYNNGRQNKYKIYVVNSCRMYTQEEMAELDYGEVTHDYFVYTMGNEVLFEDIELKSILEDEIGDGENPYIKPPIQLSGRTIFGQYRKQQSKK